MNRFVEFHDSTLVAVETAGRDIIIHLAPAYLHTSEGRPGIDPGTGWLQDVSLVIREAVIQSIPSLMPCQLHGGNITVGSTTWLNGFPLPLLSSASTSLLATTERGESLAICGSGAEALPRGELQYVEQFPGADGN